MTSRKGPAIAWFRRDLRLTDNPALTAAADGGEVLPVFVLDDESAGDWRAGSASRWWLHQSLASLDRSLDGRLRLFVGKADEILPRLAREVNASVVCWNRCYEPWRIEQDARIEDVLNADGVATSSHNGSLLFEPHTVSKQDGTPYKVFTPFYRKGCLQGARPPGAPLESADIRGFDGAPTGVKLDDLGLLPKVRWYDTIANCWQPGEAGALERLERFLADGIDNYRKGRDRPDRAHVSRLSPHLQAGEISPRQVWHAANTWQAMRGHEDDVDHFLSELGWREFSYYLLYHWPDLPRKNLQAKFDRFPWRNDDEALECWQQGRTGYPIVDAGMRELWQTGYMHNRVRMIVGSFLVKNLMLHWHHGEAWFWDTLVDADLANNSASWQWIAGCGADAAPYFRIFNPVTQGNKFDPDGDYVRRYVPELSELPTRHLHSPWEAPADVLDASNVVLGENYPRPIVDLKASRERALEAFASLKS